MDIIDEVYYTLLGQLIPEAALPWVENAFAPGSDCDIHITKIYEARNRLQERLHAAEEDPDLECILDASVSIQHILCRMMFLCGAQYQGVISTQESPQIR